MLLLAAPAATAAAAAGALKHIPENTMHNWKTTSTMSQLQPQQQTQGLLQPYIHPEYASALDTRNSLHASQFYNLTGQFLRIGEQHPDDKKKAAHQWYEQQVVQIVEEFRVVSTSIDTRHYPGQLTVPKSTSAEYKRDKKHVCVL